MRLSIQVDVCSVHNIEITCGCLCCTAVHSTAIICDTECTGGCLCCTALPLPVRLSIQVDVYSVHSIEITCDAEHTGECLCCT